MLFDNEKLMMKLEISCENLHCGHTSLLGIKGSVDKFSYSPRESAESPQGISKIRHTVCLVQFTVLAIETFAYQLGVCPAQCFLTAHPTAPYQVVLADASGCILQRILRHIPHSFIFPVPGAAKVSTEVNIF